MPAHFRRTGGLARGKTMRMKNFAVAMLAFAATAGSAEHHRTLLAYAVSE
jgi:hypothetical protein